MPAQLEADQVVLLVLRRRAAHTVFTHLFQFQRIRVVGRRPDRARPAVSAERRGDVRLRDIGIDDAGCAREIGVVRAL